MLIKLDPKEQSNKKPRGNGTLTTILAGDTWEQLCWLGGGGELGRDGAGGAHTYEAGLPLRDGFQV